jgi:hypothetical protein
MIMCYGCRNKFRQTHPKSRLCWDCHTQQKNRVPNFTEMI